ncbi:hypothetical protein ccbrp13_56140 [Ktedonobacteria bacterium brp13]|nr:hypothetical protein ccbrp13_56140 [Ktedonobacteria bacterium brp13]
MQMKELIMQTTVSDSLVCSATLPLPPGVNASYKIVRVPTRSYKNGMMVYASRLGATPALEEFKQSATFALAGLETASINWGLVESIKLNKYKTPLRVVIKFFYPTLWKCDVDGGIKAVQDVVFKKLELNDNLVVELVAKKFDDKFNPRVEIEITCVSHTGK